MEGGRGGGGDCKIFYLFLFISLVVGFILFLCMVFGYYSPFLEILCNRAGAGGVFFFLTNACVLDVSLARYAFSWVFTGSLDVLGF